MKRSVRIILPLLLISIFSSVHFVQVEAAYQVTVGQTFDYDAIKASIAVTVNGVSGSGAGYTIDGHQYGENTQFTIIVDTVGASGVDWILKSMDFYSENSGSSVFGDLQTLGRLLVYPLFLVTPVISPGDTSQGLGVIILPFWDPDYFDVFEDLADPSTISERTTEPGWEDLTIQAKYDDSGSDVIFDWYMAGTIATTSGAESMNINIDHNFKMVYEKSTGVMQGLRMVSSLDGTVLRDSIDISSESHTEKSGYDIPAFEFGGGGLISGFGWIAAVGAIAFLAALPITIRKFRK